MPEIPGGQLQCLKKEYYGTETAGNTLLPSGTLAQVLLNGIEDRIGFLGGRSTTQDSETRTPKTVIRTRVGEKTTQTARYGRCPFGHKAFPLLVPM